MPPNPHGPVTIYGNGWRSLKYLAGRYLARRPYMTGRAGEASFRFKTEDAVGRHIYKHGDYEPALRRLVEREVHLAAGEVALDVGANIGWYAVLLARLAAPGARIYAFEPDPLNFNLLCHNLDTNRSSQVTPVDLALAAERGSRSLYRYPAKNLGRHSMLPINAAEPLGIQAVNGDEFLADHDVSPEQVRFIKIDVEGFEHEVVRGLRRTLASCPLVICEFSPGHMCKGGQDVGGFLTFLEGCGLRPFRLDPTVPGLLTPTSLAELEQLESTVDLVWRR
jgi:FkbM family methyltransferase